jgi:hypothetical protein
MMDIWQKARDKVKRDDLETAWSLGFDYCRHCDDWFSVGDDGWEDCVECGRYCPSCAESIDWAWCEICGFTYCQSCMADAEHFKCSVCLIEI